MERLDEVKEKEYHEQGLQASHDDRRQQLVHRLQLARPGGRQGRHARAAGRAQPQAAPGALDRDRLGGGHVAIFRSKGGVAAQGPLPPALFGSREGTGRRHSTRSRTRWSTASPCAARSKRRSKLLAEAGYPDGRDAKTGKPLVLNFDYQRAPTPGDQGRARLDGAKQFAKIGVQLEIRATDYNQFQDKMHKGKHQIFFWGWLADYPGRGELPVHALRAERRRR